jgi:lipopolysaccharide exporter
VTLARKTVLGAMWTIATSIGSRIVGLAGTLALTHFLAEDVYGEVQNASVIALTASIASNLTLGQYLVANPKAGRVEAFHATFYHLVLGLLALGAALALSGTIGPLLQSPRLADYLPGLALSAMLDRFTFMPEKIMYRDMRFRDVGLQQSAGEVAYASASVGLAMAGMGGMAIVYASLARSVLRLGLAARSVSWRDWLEPHRLSLEVTKKLLAFGAPLSLANLAMFGSRRWDNLLVSRLFGPGTAGVYNLAYNLADIPATQIGEHIGDVLVPSFAQLEGAERRRAALLRALRLLLLLVTPLAIGLGAVAESVVGTFFGARWRGVAAMLTVLSALSVVRPVGWIVQSYMQAQQRTRVVMVLELAKTALLMGVIATLGRLGPLWACGAVGVAFGAHALASLMALRLGDEPLPWGGLLGGFVGPLAASAPMAAAVLGVRHGLRAVGLRSAPLSLALELVAGGLVYVPAALVFARATSRDLLALLKDAVARRKGKAAA